MKSRRHLWKLDQNLKNHSWWPIIKRKIGSLLQKKIEHEAAGHGAKKKKEAIEVVAARTRNQATMLKETQFYYRWA